MACTATCFNIGVTVGALRFRKLERFRMSGGVLLSVEEIKEKKEKEKKKKEEKRETVADIGTDTVCC